MEERSTKFSLLVTGVFLIGLLVLTAILRPSRSSSATDRASSEVAVAPAVTPAPAPAVASAISSSQPMLPPPNRKIAVPGPHERHEDLPSVPEEKSRQQILTNCKLRTDGANDGDTVTVLTRSGEYRFSLYFVDVPDFSRGGIQQMQAYSAYFGNLSEQDLRTVAKEAQSYIASVLGHHSFDVVTRWERAPEESPDPQVITSRAFVYCEGRQGEMVNLASLLVDRGLATVCNAAEMLPDEMTSQAYLAYLQKLEQAAIANKRGAWKFSQGVAMTSSQQVMPVKYQTR